MASVYGQVDNSNWQFVGPISENLENGNKFETSRLNDLDIDPIDDNNMAASGHYAGLWISRNHADSWESLPTQPYFNGVSAVAFNKSHQLIVADLFYPQISSDRFRFYTTHLYKYDFNSENWTQLTDLPIVNEEYLVYKILVDPRNDQKIFVGTSAGLFVSGNGGASWTAHSNVPFLIRDIEILDDNGTDYSVYLSGTKTTTNEPSLDKRKFIGAPLLMCSLNSGATFIEVPSYKTAMENQYGNTNQGYVAEICYVKDNDLNLETIGIQTAIFPTEGAHPYTGTYGVHECEYNKSTTQFQYTHIKSIGGTTDPTRIAIEYDEINQGYWMGGITLRFKSPTVEKSFGTSSLIYSPHRVHSDIQDIIVNPNEPNELFVASDGGINVASDLTTINGYSVFTGKNNGLNVSLINGFSGASEDPNYYLIGLQDIVHTNLYDEATQRPRYTHYTHENEGGIISSKNNDLIILDKSSYSSGYQVSHDGGATKTGTQYPQNVGQYPNSAPFGQNTYFQDPFRDRLYYGLTAPCKLAEYDHNTNKFVGKILFSDCGSYLTWGWSTSITSMSFCKNDENSIHISTNANIYDTQGGSIYKYIGSDFDAMKKGVNDCHVNGQEQWQNITPQWLGNQSNLNYSLQNFMNPVASNELGEISYVGMVSSNSYDNMIYVAVDGFRDNDAIKVIRYNGTGWDDHSQGIPTDEHVSSISIDYESRDAVYIITNKAVYYRDAYMQSWVPYITNWPMTGVKQMEINQKERTLRAGTYGKGIWKTPLVCPSDPDLYEHGTYSKSEYLEAMNIYSDATVPSGLNVTYKAAEKVTLQAGFNAQSGSAFHAFISPCSLNLGGRPSIQIASSLDDLQVVSSLESTEGENASFGSSIHPNPSAGSFTIVDEKGISNIRIYDLKGNQLSQVNTAIHSSENYVNLGNLPNGVYVIRYWNNNKEVSKKIIIEK